VEAASSSIMGSSASTTSTYGSPCGQQSHVEVILEPQHDKLQQPCYQSMPNNTTAIVKTEGQQQQRHPRCNGNCNIWHSKHLLGAGNKQPDLTEVLPK
jgi:steroid 5-alpha reductase family enzyme